MLLNSALATGISCDIAWDEDGQPKGMTPLMAAAQNGHTDVCRLLLETFDADVNQTRDVSYRSANLIADIFVSFRLSN